MEKRSRRIHRWFLAAGWCAAVGSGAVWLTRYSFAGDLPVTSRGWPGLQAFSLDPSHPTLVLVLHPRCACSRASAEQLDRLVARHAGRFEVHVLFVIPTGEEASWSDTDLRTRVEAIPGVHVHLDMRGRDAALLAASRSGDTMLFSPTGDLLFRGGLTASRGHAGDSIGTDALSAVLSHGGKASVAPPIFGCGLAGSRRETSR